LEKVAWNTLVFENISMGSKVTAN